MSEATQAPDFQRVLLCLAKTEEKILQLAWVLRNQPRFVSANSSHSLRSYSTSRFHYNWAITINDPAENRLTWDLVCQFRSGWSVELEIFLARKEMGEDENIVSYPFRIVETASELIAALEWGVAEIETSITSRDISSWVELATS